MHHVSDPGAAQNLADSNGREPFEGFQILVDLTLFSSQGVHCGGHVGPAVHGRGGAAQRGPRASCPPGLEPRGKGGTYRPPCLFPPFFIHSLPPFLFGRSCEENGASSDGDSIRMGGELSMGCSLLSEISLALHIPQ